MVLIAKFGTTTEWIELGAVKFFPNSNFYAVPITLPNSRNLILLSLADENEPSVQIVPKSSVYDVGEKRAIYCRGENLKEPLTWYGPDGKEIEGRSDTNNRVFVERQNGPGSTVFLIAMIQSAKIEDTGNWTCRSSNKESTISVLVGEKANIESTERVEEEEGSKVTLDCDAKGNPRPEAQWYHDHGDPKEHRISNDTNPKKYSVQRRGTNLKLTIKNLNHNDSGEYICKVTQKALSYYTNKQVILDVIHSPVIRLVHSNEVYALVNETKNITCSAKAHPAPEYKWYRRINNFDDPIIEEGTVFTSEDNLYSVLLLRVHSKDDLGEYKCTATNKKGSESVIFDVSLGNKPEPPDFVEVISSSLNELVFNVTCENCTFSNGDIISPHADNLAVTGYSFQLVPAREAYPANWDEATTVMVDIEDSANTTFPVGNLPNGTTFNVRVQTCNQAGCSDWLEVHPDPKTTDFGVIVTATPVLILLSIILLFLEI